LIEGLAGVRAAVVDDPVDSARRCVGLCGHDLLDEPAERLDPGRGLDAVKQVGVVDVPGGQVGQRPVAVVLELEPPRAAPSGRERRVAATERLQFDFSSAQITYSSGRSRRPSKRRC